MLFGKEARNEVILFLPYLLAMRHGFEGHKLGRDKMHARLAAHLTVVIAAVPVSILMAAAVSVDGISSLATGTPSPVLATFRITGMGPLFSFQMSLRT